MTVHHDGKQFDHIITNNIDEWDQSTIEELQAAIRNAFNLSSAFDLYENVDGDEVAVDDKDDLQAAFEDKENEEAASQKHLHLFVQIHRFLLIYGKQSSEWLPSSVSASYGESEWSENYESLLRAASNAFGLILDSIGVQRDGIDIDDGEELLEQWKTCSFPIRLKIMGDRQAENIRKVHKTVSAILENQYSSLAENELQIIYDFVDFKQQAATEHRMEDAFKMYDATALNRQLTSRFNHAFKCLKHAGYDQSEEKVSFCPPPPVNRRFSGKVVSY